MVTGIDPAIGHGAPPTDIDFIGNLLSIAKTPMTDQTASTLATYEELKDTLVSHQPLKRP
jgi:hypothetical protein